MIEKAVFDPDQPERLLAFSGSSRRCNTCDTFGCVWQSTDDGESWSHLTTFRLLHSAEVLLNAYFPRPGESNGDLAVWFDDVVTVARV